MEQRKLYKTLEALISKDYTNDYDIFDEVLKLIIKSEMIDIKGARIWRLFPEKGSYKILMQVGAVYSIEENFLLNVDESEIFQEILLQRTILASETNEQLKEKGIDKFTASGIGNKIKIDEKKYYEYILAVNSDNIDKSLRYSLNIVATFLTQQLSVSKFSVQKKSLIEHIDKAKQLQRSILPEHEINFFNYNIFGVTLPAEIVGGDYFDYLKIGRDEERLGIVVGDAASKGLGAAAEAMYISGAVRMASNFQIKISALMSRMNNLVNKIFSDDKFTTMFYGEISNDNRGLFLFANGGHNPPMFVRAATNEIIYLNTTGPLLGPAPNSKYETDSINFKIGDILVVFSDGIVEAANNEFEFYGEKRLEKLIKENHQKSSKDLSHIILDDVIKFSTSQSKYQDDKTIVVVKRVK